MENFNCRYKGWLNKINTLPIWILVIYEIILFNTEYRLWN